MLASQTRYEWEIIFVDDGSKDGSVAELATLAQERAAVTVVELARNFGQQKAFMIGLAHAQGDVVVTLDGDFQYDPSCVIALADKVNEGHDIVSGVRHDRKDPWFSRLTSRIGAAFIRRLLRAPVSDFGAVKGFSRLLVDGIVRRSGYCAFPYSMAFALSDRFAELPVTHKPRPWGASKWSFGRRLHLYFDLFLMHARHDGTAGLKLVLVSLLAAVVAFALSAPRTGASLVFVAAALFASSIFLGFCLRIHRQLIWGDQCAQLRSLHKLR